MSDPSKQKFPVAKQITVQTSNDAQSSIIAFKTADGVVGVGLKNKELSKLAALLLEQSEEVAVRKLADPTFSPTPRRSSLTLPIIRSSGLGIAPGRTDDTRTLLVEVGNLTLAFEIGASVLDDTYEDLHSNMKALSKPKRPN